MTLSNYCFMLSMLAFFFTSSKATKYRAAQKKKIETDFKQGGQRNWVQVLCNGGVASELALLFLIERGSGAEIPIHFALDYNPSWFAVAVLGSLACCNGDTWASELGSVLSKGDPFLITTFKRVPRGTIKLSLARCNYDRVIPGTNGGVSFVGLAVSALGGLVVGFVYYLSVLLFSPRDVLALAPPQWPLIVTGMLAGLFGSVLDSLMGATLQYSGQDIMTGRIVEVPSERARYISGVAILDNHSVNLLSVLITALMTPAMAMYVWTYADASSVPFGS